jgi:hypothetical protein
MLFREQAAALLKGAAMDLGCDPEALYTHALTVVARPVVQRRPFVALAVDSGFGTVLSVELALMDWAQANTPRGLHAQVLQPFFMSALAARAAEAGVAGARAHGTGLSFGLSEVVPVPDLPQGRRLREMPRAWMETQRTTSVFDNALGDANDDERFQRTRTAYAVLDANDQPLAVAGVVDYGWGREEVGVDVRRDARGEGLAKAVVTAATHAILRAGRVPYYSCGASNVRSHNNAIACGFRPVFARASVSA